jgi:hypothetical protein
MVTPAATAQLSIALMKLDTINPVKNPGQENCIPRENRRDGCITSCRGNYGPWLGPAIRHRRTSSDVPRLAHQNTCEHPAMISITAHGNAADGSSVQGFRQSSRTGRRFAAMTSPVRHAPTSFGW